MPDYTLPHIQIPPDYAEFLSLAAALNISGLELFGLPLQSVAEYAHTERVPPDFPRPQEHFVIADYCICLPVVAIDLSTSSSTLGRVLSYSYGNCCIVGDSLSDLLNRLKAQGDSALWGKE
jgi:hypothetical protein